MSQNIFSLEGLIGWLETQPPENAYSYCSSTGCLIHQYLSTRGVPIFTIDGESWRDTAGQEHSYPRELNSIAIGTPKTYGAALQRARELLAGEHNAPPSS